MPTERRLAAIMFTDIVGYTALMAGDLGEIDRILELFGVTTYRASKPRFEG